MFRESFGDAEELREKITREIHRYELAHAAGPVDAPALLQAADQLLPDSRGDRQSGTPMLRFALVGGPVRQIIRPAELEADALSAALHQRAMFFAPKLFDPTRGVERSIERDALVLSQERGASIRLDERAAIVLGLPLEKSRSRDRSGFGGIMLGIIEETVVAELASAVAFADWALDHVDPTQRLTHVALTARIDASDYLGWLTQAEQDASPNSGSMSMGRAPQNPAHLHRPRAALKFDAQRIAEDVMVPLRRQWKT